MSIIAPPRKIVCGASKFRGVRIRAWTMALRLPHGLDGARDKQLKVERENQRRHTGSRNIWICVLVCCIPFKDGFNMGERSTAYGVITPNPNPDPNKPRVLLDGREPRDGTIRARLMLL